MIPVSLDNTCNPRSNVAQGVAELELLRMRSVSDGD